MTGPFALGLTLAAAAAAAPPAHYHLDELFASPLAFAGRLLGRPAPEIVEAQALGAPGVAQYSSVSLFFVPHARGAGWSDLCRLDMQSVTLSFVEPRDAAGTLIPSAPEHLTLYALVRARPTFAPMPDGEAEDAGCRGLGPFLNRPNWQLATVTLNGEATGPVEAVFAYRAAAAAGGAERFAMDPCQGAEAHCVAGLEYVRALDLRDLYRLDIAPCRPGAPALCVTGRLENDRHDGSIVIRIETDSDAVAPERPVHARSVTIGASLYPVA